MLCKITKTSNGNQDQSRLITLPKSYQELNAFLMDMSIGKDNDWQYQISNLKTGTEIFNNALKDCQNIDELNFIAQYFDKCNSDKMQYLEYIIEMEKPQNAKDFINIMYDSEDYTIYNDTPTFEELGKEIAFNFDGVDSDSPLGMCINYKEYGESFHDAHGGRFVGGAYIMSPINEPRYDGIMLPDNDKFGDSIMALKITTERRVNDVNNDPSLGDPAVICVELPTTNYALERTANRLGADSLDECIIYDCLSIKTYITEFIEPTSSITEVNALTEVMSSLNERHFAKFEAVCFYENDASIGNMINFAYNLDCYEFNPEIQSAEDFVMYTYDDDPVKLAQADELDGETLLAKCGGKITPYGFVARNDTQMTEVYVPEPDSCQDFIHQM